MPVQQMRHGPVRDSLPDNPALAGGVQLESWPTLLIVDDDEQMLHALVLYFEKRGFHVAAVNTVADAKVMFSRRKSWTLVLSDYHLPDGTGWELCCWIEEQIGRAPPFLLMSGSSQDIAACPEMDFLAKPFLLSELESRVQAVLHRR